MRPRFVLIAFLASLACASTTRSQQPTTKPTNNTIFAAHLDEPIPEGKNVLWCATLQVAWDRFSDFLGGPILLDGNPPEAVGLSTSRFPTEWIGADDLIVDAGKVGAIIPRIDEQLRRKFGPEHDARLLNELRDADSGAYGMYAYLQKRLAFARPFEREELTFSWLVPDPDVQKALLEHRSSVVSFGIDGFDPAKAGQQEMAQQVQVLWWSFAADPLEESNEFVVELKTTATDDRLILASIPSRPTLRQAVDLVMQRVTRPNTIKLTFDDHKRIHQAIAFCYSSSLGFERSIPSFLMDTLMQSRSLLKDETLAIPLLRCDLTASFDNLLHRKITAGKHSAGEFLFIKQRISFSLNERGADLVSEAAAAGLFGGMSRDFYFSRPFLVLLLRKDAPKPYFAAWIGNADLLERMPGEAGHDSEPKPRPNLFE